MPRCTISTSRGRKMSVVPVNPKIWRGQRSKRCTSHRLTKVWNLRAVYRARIVNVKHCKFNDASSSGRGRMTNQIIWFRAMFRVWLVMRTANSLKFYWNGLCLAYPWELWSMTSSTLSNFELLVLREAGEIAKLTCYDLFVFFIIFRICVQV